MRATGRPDFPFMLCWTNHNWNRRWDGGEHEILLEQTHDDDERAAHIEYLVDVFSDARYLRLDDRPIFGLYQADAHPRCGVVLARISAQPPSLRAWAIRS